MTAPSSLDSLKLKLDALVADFRARMAAAGDEQSVRKAYADFGGPQGSIRSTQKDALKAAPGPEKRAIGELGNTYLKELDSAFEVRLAAISAEAAERDLSRRVDVTLPGRTRRRGHLHPLTIVRRECEEIFAQLGFVVVEGPEVETDFHNFEALAVPKEHPARDMQDTFYINERLLLRTHTSAGQIRAMRKLGPGDLRVALPGLCYRNENITPRSEIQFHQIEGLLVGERVRMSDLKGVLLQFARLMFGPEQAVRFRASYFPFTEPSVEVDVRCTICGGSGCRVCKQSGWLELLGAGMVHPVVLQNGGYDPEKYRGFAFGMGIERQVLLRYDIHDIRLLFGNDLRMLRQFH